MNLKRHLTLTLLQWRELFRQELGDLIKIAEESPTNDIFKRHILTYIQGNTDFNREAKEQIKRLIEMDGKSIKELSTESQMHLTTISLLYAFLNGKWDEDLKTDCILDLYYQFKRLYVPQQVYPSLDQIKKFTDRWPTGLDDAVLRIRRENKDRIMHILIQHISCTKRASSRFCFDEGMDYDEKYKQVGRWWNDYHFQISMAARSPRELNEFLGYTLSDQTMYVLNAAYDKGIPFFVTPYYLSLLNCTAEGYDDQALRSYILYSPELVETFGQIRAWEKEDVVEAGKANAAGWLLPDGHNIHRRYPDVAILIPDTMGRACGGLCALCQRMYDFQSKRFHFHLEALRPKENWEQKLVRLLNYFEEDAQLRDILITGGDALMSQNKTLRTILDAVYQMAVNKRERNLTRPDGEKYAEIQRVRLGTRLPVYLPMRIDDELVDILRRFKEKASRIGIQQFIIQTHFVTPLEVTPEAAAGIRKILSSGWLIDNQLVYNVAASRRGHTTKLRQTLNQQGVLCYYTFTVKGLKENRAVFTPNARSVQEQYEEKRAGRLTETEANELIGLLFRTSDPAESIASFAESRQLPFLATDRNVLNLPGIGKSMTFEMVGITPQGKRILRFDHDHTRRHSPIIDQLGKVYIEENKSIAAYLCQLKAMGEDINEYASVWNYTEGKTEPRFSLYEYPDFPFGITDAMTNLVCNKA